MFLLALALQFGVPGTHARTGDPGTDELTQAEALVRSLHGAPAHGVPGPWALLGYRIGTDALRRFGKTRAQSWDVVVTHRAPAEVRYACMIDGLQAATAVSLGKLNLKHEVAASPADVESLAKDNTTGRLLRYKPTKKFVELLGGADYAEFPEAAKKLFAAPIETWVDVVEER